MNKVLKIGYFVKMFPRLSETFILNEILQLEQRGAEIVIFSIKKPNEGIFHPQVANLKAKVIYLEDLEPKKWVNWLGSRWTVNSEFKNRFFELMDDCLRRQDIQRMDKILISAWAALQAEQLQIDHYHAHFASLPSTIAYLCKLLTGKTFSFTAHAKDIFVYDMNHHYLEEKLREADFVITVTQFNKNYLLSKSNGFDPAKIKVLYNGVDLNSIAPSTNIKRNADTILGVGRLVPKKGFKTLLDACSELKRKGSKFTCWIVGDGGESENLIAQCRSLGLENNVVFLGAKTHDEIMNLMQQATVMCLPCTKGPDGNMDALPTVLLEALASRLPAVSTSISGIPEIIESGTNGLLVKPDDPSDLAEALAKLLDSGELRAKFAENGFNIAVDKFDLEKNAGSLLELYQSTIGKA